MSEQLLEQIKKLTKENQLLKQEVETRFDKEKVILGAKLEDALREKEVLESAKAGIQEQVERL